MPQWAGENLAPHELVMLTNIFVGGVSETRLSSLKNRFYTAVPVIRTDIMSALKQKGIYRLDPESANGYSAGAAFCILVPFAISSTCDGRISSVPIPVLIVSRADRGRDLVALCPGDDGEDSERVPHSHGRAGISGVHEPRGRRASQDDAAQYVREIPAIRDGAGRGTPLGTGFLWHRERSAELVRGARRLRIRHGLQSHFVFFSRCMAWRRICTRYSSRRRGPVLRDRDGAVGAGSAGAEGFPGADSAAVAAGHSKRLRLLKKSGAPGETRTPNPLLRRQMLYPVELRAHEGSDGKHALRVAELLRAGLG